MLDTRPDGHAFAAWLDNDLTLTPVETRIMHALGSRFGTWLPAVGIVRSVYRDTHHPDLVHCEVATLRTHIWRLRQKLEPTHWRIENRRLWGLYRLVSSD
jgi:DNA-binding response OmpR family regulator